MHTQHYKYHRHGKNREENVRLAMEAEEANGGLAEETPSDQLSEEANEYRHWWVLKFS